MNIAIRSRVDNNRLYVLSEDVRLFDLSTGHQISRWSVEGLPRGMSVNADNNLVITTTSKKSSNLQRILEYDGNGRLLCRVNIHERSPINHAVQLNRNQFICSGSIVFSVELNRCWTDRNGVTECDTVVKHATGSRTSTGEPSHFVVDRNGLIFTANRNGTDMNNKIVVLKPTLKLSHEVILSDDERTVQVLDKLHLDESRDRLFVGEHVRCRVFIFKLSECRNSTRFLGSD